MPAYRLTPARTITERNGRKVCEVFGAADGGDELSVSWVMLPAGCRGAEERNDYAEAIVVLSGKGTVFFDGEPVEVGAGHAIHAPKGSLWRLENTGREPLVCYSVCAPAFRSERNHREEA